MDEPGIPNHIQHWRKLRNMTQQGLAEAIEPPTTKGTISQYESAKRGFSLSRLLEIAAALGTSPGAVLDGPSRLPDLNEIASMLDAAQRELPVGVSFEDYPTAVASSLHEQLQRFVGISANVSAAGLEPSKARSASAQSRQPTKRSARA